MGRGGSSARFSHRRIRLPVFRVAPDPILPWGYPKTHHEFGSQRNPRGWNALRSRATATPPRHRSDGAPARGSMRQRGIKATSGSAAAPGSPRGPSHARFDRLAPDPDRAGSHRPAPPRRAAGVPPRASAPARSRKAGHDPARGRKRARQFVLCSAEAASAADLTRPSSVKNCWISSCRNLPRPRSAAMGWIAAARVGRMRNERGALTSAARSRSNR